MTNNRKRHTPEQVARKFNQADRMLADRMLADGADVAAVPVGSEWTPFTVTLPATVDNKSLQS